MSIEPIKGIQILPFLEELGFNPVSINEIRSGRNSRVLKVLGESRDAILKVYHRSPGYAHDRLHAEYSFLSLLSSVPSIPVARPFGCDKQLALGLYEVLPGVGVTGVSDNDISQAGEFIKQINQLRDTEAATTLGDAAEACWTVQQHVQLVALRVSQLREAISNEEDSAASEFVEMSLHPALLTELSKLTTGNLDNPRLKNTPNQYKILSPSDFGFHNVLRAKSKLWFIDFEYAGWDDPVKLLCDFACQPEVPMSQEHVTQFWQTMADWLQDNCLLDYAMKLLPLYRVKWCCILLNEFMQIAGDRRQHANPSDPGRKATQLSKAQQYFYKHVVTN